MDPNAILPLSGDRQAAAEAKRGVVEGTDAKGGVVSVVERSRLGAPAWQPSNVATSTKPVRVRLKLRLLVLRPNEAVEKVLGDLASPVAAPQSPGPCGRSGTS